MQHRLPSRWDIGRAGSGTRRLPIPPERPEQYSPKTSQTFCGRSCSKVRGPLPELGMVLFAAPWLSVFPPRFNQLRAARIRASRGDDNRSTVRLNLDFEKYIQSCHLVQSFQGDGHPNGTAAMVSQPKRGGDARRKGRFCVKSARMGLTQGRDSWFPGQTRRQERPEFPHIGTPQPGLLV